MEITLGSGDLEKVLKAVNNAGITFSHLQNDLIDHICCDLEEEMRNGLSFDNAWKKVRMKIGLGGLERIQQDTLYLIDQKYRIMKNTMKISGVIAPILLVLGTMSKINHWPVAGIFLVAGFLLMALVFLPSAMYVSYREVSNRTRKWTYIAGFLGTFFTSTGFLFRIQHWPLTPVFLVLGFVLIVLVFLPMLAISRLKEKTGSTPGYIYVLAMLGLMLSLSGFLCKMMHWPGAGLFLTTGILVLVGITFPVYMFNEYKQKQFVAGSYIYLMVIVVWFIVPVTLISLNPTSPILKYTESEIQHLNSAYDLLSSINKETPVKYQGDSVVFRLHQNAGTLIENLETQKTELNQGYQVPNDQLIKTSTGLKNHYEQMLLAISPNPQYQENMKRLLAWNQDSPGQTGSIRITHLMLQQQAVAMTEQLALREYLRLRNTDVSK